MTVRESTVAPCALPGTPLAAARDGIDACVHCGFCLQACPTYLALEDENDSPRGRILLMRSALEGRLALADETLHTHIDRCLGCRACETACPSGVPYGRLLEATRATMRAARPLPPIARLILWVFARGPLLRAFMAAGRLTRTTRISRALMRLPGRLGFAMAMLESTRRPRGSGASPSGVRRIPQTGAANVRFGAGTAETGASRRAVVLTGCVMEGLLASANRATEHALAVNGFSLSRVPDQVCCGALHAHAGDMNGARRLAKKNVAAFEASGDALICVNAAGCGAMMKEYPHLFDDDAEWRERSRSVASRVRDVSELLAAAGPAPVRSERIRVTYDAPCHLLHAQRIASEPLTMLEALDGIDFVPLEGMEHCCGAAGIYNLVEPETSSAVLDPKLREIDRTGAEVLATGNPGCMMQIGAGLLRAGSPVRVLHPVELLDNGYRADV